MRFPERGMSLAVPQRQVAEEVIQLQALIDRWLKKRLKANQVDNLSLLALHN